MRIQHVTRLTPLHIAAGLLLGGFCFSTAYGQASFQGLGNLPGSIISSKAVGVSADGSVVVGRSVSDSGTEAYRWTSEGGLVGLGDFEGGVLNSTAVRMSADGSVVVGHGTSASAFEAYRWMSGGGMVSLGGLGNPTGGLNSFLSVANGVSADGLVVVGRSNTALGNEAFRWTSGDGMVGLGDLPGGIFDSRANDICADGSVVVGRSDSVSGREAFRWTSGGGLVGLGDLPGGSFRSSAIGISDDGSTVVGWGLTASGTEAFRWTSEDGMEELADDVFTNSFASDVSADGSVVVGMGIFFSPFQAMIWDATNGAQSLQAVLEGQLGLDLTGWTLNWAHGVSADGTTIVGYGTNPDGVEESFIAVIPGPGVCLGDIVGLDGKVNVTDLLSLLGGWGPNPGHPADINDDGQVNVTDLLVILGAWGACP